jgi:D-arabinose 1-dehydrogenase-like Zn-dependent alcohol dehydrogenase
MISLEDKMLVAENCIEYKPKKYIVSLSMSSICTNCDYCENYKNNICSKGLFEKIDEMVKIN